jgi:hypothetical protein
MKKMPFAFLLLVSVPAFANGPMLAILVGDCTVTQ